MSAILASPLFEPTISVVADLKETDSGVGQINVAYLDIGAYFAGHQIEREPN